METTLQYLIRNYEQANNAKPSDIQSKIECADVIENWVANYLRS